MPADPPRPACTRDDATAVVRALRDAGHVAYFAGGCVRDLLLGHAPKDYDVATDAPPQRVRQLFRNTQAVGAAFGVILVRHGRSVVEVATFRTDGTYTDGRRPDTVTFATAEEDAKRRDFTINGLFMDPLDGDRVIDHVGGQADLSAGVIRAIGNPDERFAEDHLRLLRAVRFAARLGFRIDHPTQVAVVAHAVELRRIQPERIADELRRMLAGPNRPRAWTMLEWLGLNAQVFRHLPTDSPPCPTNAESFVAGLAEPTSFGAVLAAAALECRWRWAGQLGDIRPWLTKGEVGRVVRATRQGLRISNDESADLEGTLLGAGAMLADPEPGVAGKKRFLATPTAVYSRGAVGRHCECRPARRADRRRTTGADRDVPDRICPAPAGDRRRPDGRRRGAGAGVQTGAGRGVRRPTGRAGIRPGCGTGGGAEGGRGRTFNVQRSTSNGDAVPSSES